LKTTITLRDTEDGQVQVEEIRYPATDETDQSVTVATALADEMLSLLDKLGDTED